MGGVIKNWKRRWFSLKANKLKYYENNDKKKLMGFFFFENIQKRIGKKERKEDYKSNKR